MANPDPLDACLTDDEQRRCLAGEMEESQSGRARRHLHRCSACAGRARTLQSELEAWAGRLRAAGPPRWPGELGRSEAATAGELIPGYEIEREISRGGQGIVYRALQRSTRRSVAIKVLREGPMASRAARHRFEREVELVAGFRHPHVVTVHDFGSTADGRQYCVMDLVAGLPLDAYVRHERPSVERIVNLFVRICDGVNYAHRRGVIHRDLKPANVAVEPGDQPRVLDFGLARPVDHSTGAAVTTEPVVAGTLPYLSPEQATGKSEDVDVRCDVYAIGVMLYEVLAGVLPYDVGGGLMDGLKAIAEVTPAPPSQLWQARGVPRRLEADLETIVLKALAKDRERRYQTAGDLARDLERLLAGEPIEARRDSRWYLLRAAVRRHRWPLAAGISVVLVIAGAAGALAVMYRQQVRQTQLARTAERQARQRFDQLRALARSYIFDFDEKIAELSGATDARRLMTTTALEYLDSLAREAGGDPALQAELAAAYYRVGQVQGGPDLANLGEFEAALASYAKCERISEELLDREPGSAEHGRNLWRAIMAQARILGTLQRLDESGQKFERAATIVERLATAYPGDINCQRDLCTTWNDLAGERWARGRLDEALDLVRRANSLSERTARQKPGDPALQRDLAVGHMKLGQLLQQTGKLAEAESEFRAYLAIIEPRAEAEPFNARAQRDWAVGLQKLAWVFQERGRAGDALPLLAKELELQSTLAARDPNDHQAEYDRLAALCKIGEVRLAQGDRSAAETMFRQYLESAERIVARRPDWPPGLRERAVAWYKLGESSVAQASSGGGGLRSTAAYWAAAERSFQEARRQLIAMRDRGLLAPADAAAISELEAEIERCRRSAKPPVEANSAQ